MKKIMFLVLALLLVLTGCGQSPQVQPAEENAPAVNTFQLVSQEEAAVIPEADSVVLVYCRSGNRSKVASQALADLGYTNVYKFGGISTWPYEVE